PQPYALTTHGPQLALGARRASPGRTVVAGHEPLGGTGDGVRFNDDAVQMGLQAATHWDALAHVSYAGRMYNGFSPSVVTDAGAARLGAERIGAVVGRGVLL